MADEFSYSTSCEQQETEFEFSSRQYAYIPDQNSGNYPSSQITFDLASLSNSGKFVDWAQTYLTIPLVLNVATSTAMTGFPENVFAASLKNFPTLINSLSVEITNNQVVNLTQFSNLDINYKVLSSMSNEDAWNLNCLGFAKDTAESISYNAGLASNFGSGLGEINNVIKATPFTPTAGFNATTFPQNVGRLQRMMNTSFDPTTSASSVANCNATGKNYAVQTAAGITYYIIATIPLRFLHDIFKKLPMCKGMYMRLMINTNCGVTVTNAIAPNTATNLVSSYASSVVVSQNNVCPIMLSPLTSATTTGQGLNLAGMTAGGATITTTLNIAKFGAVTHPTMSQCRVYACLYEMSPIWEEKYFSMVPTKKVLYNDILTFQTLNVGAGSQVSQILSNGVSRMRYLLIYPFLASTINGSTNITDTANGGLVLGTPMNSPFTSCPSTTCPQAALTNMNILLSGTNLYQSNINYGFEHYLQEVRGSNAINGGLSLGMSSGLLSQGDWENGYRIGFFDLSRKVSQASDDISRSIQVVFTNASKVQMDYYYVIGYEREVTLSTATGSLVI